MTEEDHWREDGIRYGWTLPAPAPWPLRLPIIRNVRAAWVGISIDVHYWRLGGMLGLRSGYDDWVHWAISRGKC